MKIVSTIILIVCLIALIISIIYLFKNIKAHKLRKINIAKTFDKIYSDSIQKEAEYHKK